MAINVNTVYQTVLLILNKEQRGYMTPVEFNKTASQAQLEIFETYFDSLNQQIRIPQTDADYSNRVTSIDEKISIFKEIDTATYTTGGFKIPSQYSGLSSSSQQFTSTTSLTYTLTGDTLALSNSGGIPDVFLNNVQLSNNDFSLNGATLTLSSQPTVGQIIIINIYPKQFYKLGQVLYNAGGVFPIEEIQRVERGELYHLLTSDLTAPTATNPICLYEKNILYIYPQTIQSGVQVAYIRKPTVPMWNFTGTNQYVFSAISSNNFELHSSEQAELILKILLYAGVVIRDTEIIQVAAAQIQQENTNQKS
jgi:hypothetical protein